MSQPPFEIWDVSEWEVAADEPAGLEERQWLTEPATGVDWLFKPPTEKFGFRQGEDWSEKVSSESSNFGRTPMRFPRHNRCQHDLRPFIFSLMSPPHCEPRDDGGDDRRQSTKAQATTQTRAFGHGISLVDGLFVRGQSRNRSRSTRR
jgi:hypothetical protein